MYQFCLLNALKYDAVKNNINGFRCNEFLKTL